ncbi:MAG TPA: hypothetical protein PL041_04095 [Melioribacteraceae bacterium]|nr:hypothetical protein [Melioribacteraceae bacterium]
MENEKPIISLPKEQADLYNLHKIYTAETGKKIENNINALISALEILKTQAVVINNLVESTDRLIKDNSSYLVVIDK